MLGKAVPLSMKFNMESSSKYFAKREYNILVCLPRGCNFHDLIKLKKQVSFTTANKFIFKVKRNLLLKLKLLLGN